MIDLKFCLNLLDARFIELIRPAYDILVSLHTQGGKPLPSNTGGRDRLIRRLDCAVIETIHSAREVENDPPFDSVRAAFIEGSPIYKGAGFRTKNHIQICIRNPACIKGYFRPLDENGQAMRFA